MGGVWKLCESMWEEGSESEWGGYYEGERKMGVMGRVWGRMWGNGYGDMRKGI